MAISLCLVGELHLLYLPRFILTKPDIEGVSNLYAAVLLYKRGH